MNRIIKGLGIALGCVLIASSCSEISFGDKFLGDQPESSGATTEEMFSSKINAEKVLTKAYTGLPYGLPTGSDYKLGVNILESITSQRIPLTVMEASPTGPPSVTLGYISRT